MRKQKLLLLLAILFCKNVRAQTAFPQTEINSALNGVYQKAQHLDSKLSKNNPQSHNSISAYSAIQKMESLQLPGYNKHGAPDNLLSTDTFIVGAVPNDTVIIVGTWNHTGPIWVLNDGVLIFYNAIVNDTGDVYVFGSGKLYADSTTFNFPQQYFYERGLIAVQHGIVFIQNSSFNYSGMSHNLVLADSAIVVLNNIHQNDFTTCGLFGSPTLSINGCNLGGEYILTRNANASFVNVDTLLLWHQFEDSAVVNFSFPDGDTVYNYVFNNTVSGVSGIGYNVQADSCHTVWWALMPVNGSDITISNSTLRAIGAWFQHGDTVSVSGLYDNSSYPNFVAPLADRNLHLINSDVQTWSLYVFDSSHIDIDSCQLGEVGSQQSSSVESHNFILDGSGGYFWSTDTSFIIAGGVTVYSTVRSERNGIFILGYSWLPFLPPSAIGSSVVICVQNALAYDPIPYDGAIAWMQNISQPDSALNYTIIPVTGSAWIDQGPLGSWMDFGSYSLYYQKQGDTTWSVIVADSLIEVHNNLLGMWNTSGTASGNYLLRLLVRNNLGDSVEAIKPIVLKPNPAPVEEIESNNFTATVFPNPSGGSFQLEIQSDKNDKAHLEITNALGEKISGKEIKILQGRNIIRYENELQSIVPEIYFYHLSMNERNISGKIIIKE